MLTKLQGVQVQMLRGVPQGGGVSFSKDITEYRAIAGIQKFNNNANESIFGV